MTWLRRGLTAVGILLASSLWAAEPDPLRIGVLAFRGKERALLEWQAHADYLNRRLAPQRFVAIPLSWDEISTAVRQESVDLVITNPGHYAELEAGGKLSHIATRRIAGPQGPLVSFGGTAIRLPAREDIRRYADLRGKSILIPDKSSLGGWQVHVREAQAQGIDLAAEAALKETNDQEKVVRGVLAGEADAGFIRSDLIESLIRAGTLREGDLAVIDRRDTPGYPYLHSTRLYPEWPIARMTKLPEDVARGVLAALLDMPPDHPAARQAGIAGWTLPQNYQLINELFIETRLGPYENLPITFRDFMLSYGSALLIAASSVISLLLMALWAMAVSRRQTRTSEERYRTLFESSYQGVIYHDADGRIVSANPTAERILGVPAGELIGRTPEDGIVPRRNPDGTLIEPEQHPVTVALRSGQPVLHRVIGIDHPREGRTVWVEIDAIPQFRAGQTLPWQVVVSFEDVTERKRAEEQLKLTATVFADAREGIIITDRDGNIVDVNNTFSAITGYSRAEAIGRNPRFLASGRQNREFYEAMWHQLLETGHWRGEMWNRRKDGSVFPQLASISAVRNDIGITHFVGLTSDITALKQSQEQLELMAYYDALTGLPNRLLLADRMKQALALALRQEELLAVCYLDLDGFKPVNDTLGHAAGDRLLIEAARRLTDCVRTSDTVSRLGGDEFLVLLSGIHTMDECRQALTRIQEALNTPFQIDDAEARISASIGVTLFPLDDSDADTLIRHADQAMYSAKQAGRNTWHLFDLQDDAISEGRKESRAAIERALFENQFVLHFQPKVDMRRGRLIGAEALIRWQHPERGLLYPADFLPVVDYVGLNSQLGTWVVKAVLRQLEDWRKQGIELAVSANISADHLQEPGFLPMLAAALEPYPAIPHASLEIEILETAALHDLTQVSGVIEACRGLGVHFSIDDFGTGYSSLTYLKQLPVHTLKIDQAFVREMLHDPESLTIVDGVIGLATAFRRRAVAEGVETEAHGELLLRLGCDFGQGYGIARPMPADALPGWLGGWKAPSSWAAAGRWPREDLPLLTVETDHLRWMERFRAWALGSEDAGHTPPELDSHECHFGRWTDTDGRRRYGHLQAFDGMVEAHDAVHAKGQELAALLPTDRASAVARLDELDDASRHLVDSLHELRQIAVGQSR